MPEPSPTAFPTELPVLALRRTVAFPMTLQPLAVNRAMSVEAVNRALTGDRLLLLLLQRDDDEEPAVDRMYEYGTIGIVRQMTRGPQGLNIIAEGMARARAERLHIEDGLLRAKIVLSPEHVARGVEVDAYVRRVQELVDRALSLTSGLAPEVRQLVASIDDPMRLCYLLGTLLDLKPEERQQLLEADPLLKKLELVHSLLTREVSVLELKGKIESQAQREMTDAQRQYYLRQQMKAIQEELGEGEGNETRDLRERVESANLPESIKSVADRELDRLARMGPASPESQMIRTYLEWILELPWDKVTEDRIDPVEARRVLDEDHYDLDKVKERIVEYLAVRKLRADMKGPILCFVGPPGVGKTSLGQSIARAMNRKFVRISLGGVRDEAEIRGHRRTYIGALPGRIVQALRQAGSANPVFMLDELDKITAGYQGDPAAALLEVLDPAQNNTFRDHYLEVQIDLSKVLFIATANQIGPVHPALRDRMEIVYLSGYTEDEKVGIARRYLVPRQISEHGLPPEAVTISDETLRGIIREYTREAGVRNLERLIGAIARKIAARVATGQTADMTVDPAELETHLGPARFKRDVVFRTSRPGVATGVAWTESGGDVLYIEAGLLPGGRGQFILTGQLGDVMQESARAAVSHLRANASELGIEPNFLEGRDLHVHIPAGAIPKDGPSAGVTMATAILSAARNEAVNSDVAMTGEITLSGLVLPVGGIREKALAAKRSGLKTFILPALNEPDLKELPEEIRKDMRFVPVENLEQVLAIALPKSAAATPAQAPAPEAAGAEAPAASEPL